MWGSNSISPPHHRYILSSQTEWLWEGYTRECRVSTIWIAEPQHMPTAGTQWWEGWQPHRAPTKNTSPPWDHLCWTTDQATWTRSLKRTEGGRRWSAGVRQDRRQQPVFIIWRKPVVQGKIVWSSCSASKGIEFTNFRECRVPWRLEKSFRNPMKTWEIRKICFQRVFLWS